MREIIEISNGDITAEKDKVLMNQGISLKDELPEKVITLLGKAMDIFITFSHPVGIISDISISEFDTVYKGEGLNEKDTPVDEIFREADNLALFAVTIGEKVSKKIDELFKKNEFALGSMLDSTASAGADKAADIVENRFLNLLLKDGEATPSTGILRYSPGYCGWHISGQKKLFEFIHPEEIGITLLDSFLMKPLKSVSGVIVAGKKEIHNFEDSYPFCSQCKTHSCRERIRALFIEDSPNNRQGRT
ncbi:MAG: hypothetical protein E3J41_01355 [Candidatus Cloacimonadota bacterium]|nr:MAG: hypothetical protein E3J41_01355 [Candidatus Cloacimonadota bacterium]